MRIWCNDSGEAQSSGLGFTGALTVLFIGLKLGKMIDWPWVWVLSPLWIGLATIVGILLIIVIFTCITE